MIYKQEKINILAEEVRRDTEPTIETIDSITPRTPKHLSLEDSYGQLIVQQLSSGDALDENDSSENDRPSTKETPRSQRQRYVTKPGRSFSTEHRYPRQLPEENTHVRWKRDQGQRERQREEEQEEEPSTLHFAKRTSLRVQISEPVNSNESNDPHRNAHEQLYTSARDKLSKKTQVQSPRIEVKPIPLSTQIMERLNKEGKSCFCIRIMTAFDLIGIVSSQMLNNLFTGPLQKENGSEDKKDDKEEEEEEVEEEEVEEEKKEKVKEEKKAKEVTMTHTQFITTAQPAKILCGIEQSVERIEDCTFAMEADRYELTVVKKFHKRSSLVKINIKMFHSPNGQYIVQCRRQSVLTLTNKYHRPFNGKINELGNVFRYHDFFNEFQTTYEKVMKELTIEYSKEKEKEKEPVPNGYRNVQRRKASSPLLKPHVAAHTPKHHLQSNMSALHTHRKTQPKLSDGCHNHPSERERSTSDGELRDTSQNAYYSDLDIDNNRLTPKNAKLIDTDNFRHGYNISNASIGSNLSTSSGSEHSQIAAAIGNQTFQNHSRASTQDSFYSCDDSEHIDNDTDCTYWKESSTLTSGQQLLTNTETVVNTVSNTNKHLSVPGLIKESE
ncbi:hypothetical protein RFI_06758 [Reticulomyxa filosa]|uniref:Uncharacterized protein n=1 Tax=Reticulomyxa filosa TaxID=46433 RepID=X6NX05_RETFI|nr:hypothetical protein RFI_06758 [Reticulomyxa filosa]|eukprot:ETO30359.1 hypothetical protein RFI_06758 [Reticulomyxa filosa]